MTKAIELSEKELDQVSGADMGNVGFDSDFLIDMGVMKEGSYIHSFFAFDKNIAAVKDAWSKVGVKFDGRVSGANHYFIDGQEVSRSQAIWHASLTLKKKIPAKGYYGEYEKMTGMGWW